MSEEESESRRHEKVLALVYIFQNLDIILSLCTMSTAILSTHGLLMTQEQSKEEEEA